MEPIDSNLKDKCIVYIVLNYLFEILSPCSYFNIKTSIISFVTEININKRIANMTKELSIIPREILLPHFLGYVNQLIKQAKEKRITEKSIKIVEMFKNVIIEKETGKS